MVSETKLDESFPIGQFIIEVFGVPYRVDRNGIGGGLMLFVREDNSPTEALFRWNNPKEKEMVTQLFNPNGENIENNLQSGAKTVRLIAKERLSGLSSPIINVELEFEGSGRSLHYFSTFTWGERGGKLGSLKNFCSWLALFFEILDLEEF